MIDSKHDIKLDGTSYRLAESAEATHYLNKGETLKSPNAMIVQGKASQDFQPRPDLLLWQWTDWSAGEGRRVLLGDEAGRSWELTSVRAFEEPGHLIPGYYVEITTYVNGGADIALSLTLVTGIGALYGLDKNAANVYLWDAAANAWGAAVALTGVTEGCNNCAVGDTEAIYWMERNTQRMWKWAGTGDPELISNGLIDETSFSFMSQLGPYVYVCRGIGAKVWEIAKTGSSGIVIDSWTEIGIANSHGSEIVALHGRVYILIVHKNRSIIREITPTSAAGTGFGAELARIDGFEADAMWGHAGTLFLIGRHASSATTRTILTLSADGGTYGTLGEVRAGTFMGEGSGGATRMLDHFWVQDHLSNASPNHTLMQIDSVSGGIACLAYDEVGDAAQTEALGPVAFEGDIFWSTDYGAGDKRVMQARKDRYTISSSAVSPEHNFGLSSLKYLGSLVLACEPLPADWSLYVDYQINGDGTWVSAIVYSTTGGVGVTTILSTTAATIEFTTLRLRVRFLYTGAGVPSTGPVLLGVDARAGVSTKVRVFDLILNLADDQSSGGQARSGASKVETFLATAVKTAVVEFEDGYTNRQAGVTTTYDVTIATFDLVLDRPGEGLGVISLHGVV